MVIDCVVVLFNPTESIIQNIASYCHLFKTVYLCDNSTKKDSILLNALLTKQNIKYFDLGNNLGIAAALNVGIKSAIDDKCDYCLTMDQDSIFPISKFETIKKYLSHYQNDFAIIGLNFNKLSKKEVPGIKTCKTLITSGGFINIDAFKLTKGFKEDLFIDCVDFELDEQLYNLGFKIGYIKECQILTKIGNPIKKHFLWKSFNVMNHLPVRYYYRYRNIYYLYMQNPNFYKKIYKRYMYADRIKMLLFDKEIKKKKRMIKEGIKDAKIGLLGPYRGDY